MRLDELNPDGFRKALNGDTFPMETSMPLLNVRREIVYSTHFHLSVSVGNALIWFEKQNLTVIHRPRQKPSIKHALYHGLMSCINSMLFQEPPMDSELSEQVLWHLKILSYKLPYQYLILSSFRYTK